MLSFVILDLETTGLFPKDSHPTNRIIPGDPNRNHGEELCYHIRNSQLLLFLMKAPRKKNSLIVFFIRKKNNMVQSIRNISNGSSNFLIFIKSTISHINGFFQAFSHNTMKYASGSPVHILGNLIKYSRKEIFDFNQILIQFLLGYTRDAPYITEICLISTSRNQIKYGIDMYIDKNSAIDSAEMDYPLPRLACNMHTSQVIFGFFISFS